MYFYRRSIPGLAIYSYVIGDKSSKQCVVIDPARDVEDYIQVAEKEGFEITHIFETHVHADYICGSLELKSRLGGKPQIYCSGLGGKEWTPKYADHVVINGEIVFVGKLKFQVVHSPGHTPEHIMWELPEQNMLFTGDFLFVGDVGRPDLLGKEAQEKLARKLYKSVFTLLSPLPDSMEFFPTHGSGSLCGKSLGKAPSSTLGEQRATNPSLVEKPEQKWVDALMRDMPPAPKYFSHMKKVNIEGPKVIGTKRPGLHPLTEKQLQEKIKQGVQLVDARKKERYVEGHIPGSLGIPFSPVFSTWAGWFLSPDKPIIVRVDPSEEIQPVIDALLRVGFDRIEGHFKEEWKGESHPLEHVTPFELQHLLKEKEIEILDVRTEGEYNEGHVEGAKNIHAGLIPENLQSIPKDKPVALICRSGFRSTIAYSILEQNEYSNLLDLQGGMTAWINGGLPVVL